MSPDPYFPLFPRDPYFPVVTPISPSKEVCAEILVGRDVCLEVLKASTKVLGAIHSGVIPHLVAGKILPWRRYWTPLGGRLSAGHDGRGFMDDPEDIYGRAMNPEVHSLPDLLSSPLLVLTGQPGIGKTTEVDRLASQASTWLSHGEELVHVRGRIITSDEALRRETVDSPKWRRTIAEGGSIRLLFDATDEALRRVSALVEVMAHWLNDEPRERIKAILVSRVAEWHLADSQLLAGLWSERPDNLVYELCPLRWKDAELAAREANINPEAFHRELVRHQVTGLAARPITLRLLLEEMRRSGSLPGSHHELFSMAIERLCEEVDEARYRHERIARPKPAHIARVAARIAALSMVGARNTIVRSADEPTGDELSVKEIAGGDEVVDGEKFSVTRELLAATLDTPLFSFRGADRYGFDHQTFTEHLAADYLRTCTVPQLRRLLCVEFENIERVAPQLAEVAARVALTNTAWCDHLIAAEPEMLLRADVSPLSDQQRERAVASLLKRAEHEEAFDEAGTGYFYSTFRHPRLAEQLRPYIGDPGYNRVVRRMAIAIAGDAHVSELEPLLWQRIEAKDPASSSICNALDDLVGPHSHGRLFAALRGELPDEAGGLRSLALRKLVPSSISVREALPFLDAAPHDQHYFAYGLAKHLTIGDLPPVLQKMEVGRFVGHEAFGLCELAARTFEMAMENLDQAEVAAALANYWRATQRTYFVLPSRMMRNERDPLALLQVPEKRRTLAKLVLTLPGTEVQDIYRSEEVLVKNEDVVWLLEELPFVPSVSLPVWVKICIQKLWGNFPVEADDLLRRRYEEFLELRASLPKPSRFDIATTLRRLRQAHKLRMDRIQEHNARRYRRRTRTERLAAIWKELDSNDTVWVGFCDCAFDQEESDPKRDGHPDRGDITDSPGWLLADEAQKQGLRTAARRFLLTHRDGRVRTNYSESACHGIALLRDTLDFDQPLHEAIVERWPHVVFDEFDHGSPVQYATIAAVYRLVPDTATANLAEQLRRDNARSDGHMIDLRRYLLCWDARLVEVVRRFVFSRGLKPRAIRQVFKFLDEHDHPSGLLLLDEILKRRGGYQPLDKRGRAILAVGLFLLRAERWPDSWKVLEKCPPKLARQVFFEAVHDLLYGDLRFHERLSAQQLTEACERFMQWFPSSEYSERHDAHGHVASRHMIPDLRDGLMAELIARSTPEACRGILRLAAAAPPEERIWMRWRYNEAVKNALRRAWTGRPRTSADLLTMMRDSRALTIDTADDLLVVVLASLDRLQQRMKIAESPELHALWNEAGRHSRRSPKDEEMFSNVVHDWLQRDLGPIGGIVLNREVQATRLGKLDIKIEALSSRGGPTLTLVSENKGDWHPQVTTALGRQLVQGYLIPNNWSHGIYLVAWFGLGRARKRVTAWPPATLGEAVTFARRWQEAQCPPGLMVRAIILDCTLPERTVKSRSRSLKNRP